MKVFFFRSSLTNSIIPEGRRLVDIAYLFQQISEISKHAPFDCTFSDMYLVKENRMGLKSHFIFKCRMCGVEKRINAIKDSNDITNNVNSAATLATISTGIGYSTANELFAVLNLPFMTPTTYEQHCENLAITIEKTAWSLMEQAGKEECRLAHEMGQVNKDNIPLITVVADGAWSKRSYSVNYDALSGVVSSIFLYFRKLSSNFWHGIKMSRLNKYLHFTFFLDRIH